jgi:hypothetical protein
MGALFTAGIVSKTIIEATAAAVFSYGFFFTFIVFINLFRCVFQLLYSQIISRIRAMQVTGVLNVLCAGLKISAAVYRSTVIRYAKRQLIHAT